MKKILSIILTLSLILSTASIAVFADSINLSQIRDVDLSTTSPGLNYPVSTAENNDSLAFPFEDVTSANWFYEAVVWAVSEKITSGTDDTHFSPNAYCTRGQLVTLLWRAAGSPALEDSTGVKDALDSQMPSDQVIDTALALSETGDDQMLSDSLNHPTPLEPNGTNSDQAGSNTNGLDTLEITSSIANPFSDISSEDYFFEAVIWAYTKGIVSGTSETTFSPKAQVTREQLVKIIYGYVKTTDAYDPLDEDTNILDFDDVRSISSYAVTPFQWAVGAGVIQGIDSKLAPKDKTTRAQIVTILKRVFDTDPKSGDSGFNAIYGTPGDEIPNPASM